MSDRIEVAQLRGWIRKSHFSHGTPSRRRNAQARAICDIVSRFQQKVRMRANLMATTKQTMTDEQRKSLALEYLKAFDNKGVTSSGTSILDLFADDAQVFFPGRIMSVVSRLTVAS